MGEESIQTLTKYILFLEEACSGLAGVSSSLIEMNANLQFYDGMTTEEIQEILIPVQMI